MGRSGVIVGGGSGFRNRTCIFLKLYIKILSRHSLLVMARVDFRGERMGKECMSCMVHMKWWLIVLMPSCNLDYNDMIG